MISEQSLAEALSNKTFQLIVLPTEKCNFRCTYCYEDFSIGRMTDRTVGGIKSLIGRRMPGLSHFGLTWFGGEPLVAKDVVLNIGRFAHEECLRSEVSFSGSLTTNAYLLTPRVFSQLLDIRHKDFQITLDGDADWHDRTRRLANSQGTFETLWKHLIAYRTETRPFSITLRLHVHRDNVESVKRLYERLTADLLHDSRFKAFFHKISNLSGDKGIPQHELNAVEYSSALRYISGTDDLNHEVSADITLKDYICYAARPNSLLVRADGRIGKCTVALNDSRNDVGILHDDGSLEINNARIRPWFEGYRNMSEATLGCPLTDLPKATNLVQLAETFA